MLETQHDRATEPGSRRRRHGSWRRPDPFPVEPPHDTATRTDPGLGDALARLNAEQRTCVVLVHVFGWSYADVAEVIDAPATSVRNHVHRGLRNVRQLLEGPR